MKGQLTEQYDLTLSKREMDSLVQIVRIFVRDYKAEQTDEDLLTGLEEFYKGDTGGRAVGLRHLEGVEDDDPETVAS